MLSIFKSIVIWSIVFGFDRQYFSKSLILAMLLVGSSYNEQKIVFLHFDLI